MSKLRISAPFASAEDTAHVLGVSGARTEKLRELVVNVRNGGSATAKSGVVKYKSASARKGHYAFKKAGHKAAARKAR